MTDVIVETKMSPVSEVTVEPLHLPRKIVNRKLILWPIGELLVDCPSSFQFKQHWISNRNNAKQSGTFEIIATMEHREKYQSRKTLLLK